MEALFGELSLLANQALDLAAFDPSKMEDLMALFEQEAYAYYSVTAAQNHKSQTDAERAVREAEAYMEAAMAEAMEEYRRACEEADRCCEQEISSLVLAADAAKKLGQAVGAAASNVSKKYLDAAVAKASAAAKAAFSGASKVHPSS